MLGDLLTMAIAGSLRAVLSLPLEHPFEYLKTRKQNQPHIAVRTLLLADIRNYGFLQLYRGVSVNAVKEAVRYFYRFPSMVTLPVLVENRFALSYTQANVVSGFFLALFEACVLCPLERLKVWLITSPAHTSLRSFFNQTELTHQLYKGLTPVAVRQVTSWVTFLSTNAYLRRRLGMHEDSRVSLWKVLWISLGTAVVNITFVMPLDFIKTRRQQFSSSDQSMLQILRSATQAAPSLSQKLAIAYSGSTVRLLHFVLNSFLTTPLLEIFDRWVRRRVK